MRIHYPKLRTMTHVPSLSVFIAFKGINFYFYCGQTVCARNNLSRPVFHLDSFLTNAFCATVIILKFDSINRYCSVASILCLNITIHSRDIKTQHIKIEILKERLRLFYCNFIQHNFILNMISIGQICKENFHPFGDVMDDVTKSLVVCHR